MSGLKGIDYSKPRKPRQSTIKKHTIRTKDGGLTEVELSRSKAIKAMCTECMGWGENHPKTCTSIYCPLYPYRGKINIAY